MVLGRLIKWMTGGGWFWRRGFWFLSPVLLFAAAFAIGIVQDTTGINVLDETVRLVVLATERSQPVTLALCGAALAAGLLGLTVVVPRVLIAPDVDAAREQLETAAMGLMLTVWAAVFAFVFQWMFAALSDDLQLARVILAMSVVSWLLLVVDGLVAIPYWLVNVMRSDGGDNASHASGDTTPS